MPARRPLALAILALDFVLTALMFTGGNAQ